MMVAATQVRTMPLPAFLKTNRATDVALAVNEIQNLVYTALLIHKSMTARRNKNSIRAYIILRRSKVG